MHMILFVLDDPERLDQLLGAWDAAGVTGATIIESTGIGRRRGRDLPMRYMFGATGNYVEEGHYTLLALVESPERAQRCLEATETLLGDLNQPHTGVFVAWPVSMVKGLASFS